LLRRMSGGKLVDLSRSCQPMTARFRSAELTGHQAVSDIPKGFPNDPAGQQAFSLHTNDQLPVYPVSFNLKIF